MSQIQLGIQALHCAVEIQQKYKVTSCPGIIHYETWASLHKTVVLLNGGNQDALIDLFTYMQNEDNMYPFAYFTEDEQSLNNAMTCVGIILPERIYEGSKIVNLRSTEIVEMDKNEFIMYDNGNIAFGTYNGWEIEFMKRLSTYRLA
ncbi:MAG: hypothetical protein ACXW2E_00430 [Nitrososphaeraceae archaeon]